MATSSGNTARGLFEAPEGHPDYLALRNSLESEGRDWLESLWARFSPYVAPDFLENFRNDPGKINPLTWEMLLGCRLLELGLSLMPVRTDAPDICVNAGGKRIWFECVVPTRGAEGSADYVRPIQPFDMQDPEDLDMQEVETDKNLLRCTSIIATKFAQHRRWLAKGVCIADEAFVIAIHGRELDLSIYGQRLPDICGAVYPVGPMFVAFGAGATDDQAGYLVRRELPRSTGPAISTTSFLDPSNAHVSGVLFSLDWGPFHVSTAPYAYAYVPNVCAAHLSLDLSPLAQIVSATEAGSEITLAIP